MSGDRYSVRAVTALTGAEADGLGRVLIDCVEGGASVGFMRPMTEEKARAFWRRVARDVERGARALLVAEDAIGIVGTVQVVLEQPENQPHRADISKMLVHRRARRRGIGAALMRAAEDAARRSGKSLLVLDTASGDAERLYARLGWSLVGVIPDYALWPGGGFSDTTVFYRKLD
ncbi:MAG TPA: GNAT family N-acetyltransferase [Stellaceae bacterium]|nr:GNAT family N-acetyltransferase [Stellaceae bacterium]